MWQLGLKREMIAFTVIFYKINITFEKMYYLSIEPSLFKILDISKYVPDICSPKDRN